MTRNVRVNHVINSDWSANDRYVTLQQPEYNGVWLQHERLSAPAVAEETRLLDAWASPTPALSAVATVAAAAAGLEPARQLALDDETRRAAFDPQLLPSALLLLQVQYIVRH
jgi:hypothetical protein